MSVKASSGSPLVKPQLYRTTSTLAISQAEQQDRFLDKGELNQLSTFLNSGAKRLEIADILTKNANIIVGKAADKIFTGGSPISYLERPQASIQEAVSNQKQIATQEQLSGDVQTNLLGNIGTLFAGGEATPPGFKPINVTKYGPTRMKKSVRDLDWFLRYLTYAIVSGDPNILTVNIRGLRELIDNACSSSAAIVALREMRRISLSIFENRLDDQNLVREYFNAMISEFEGAGFTDKLKKRNSKDLQGLRLPQIYAKAGIGTQKFVMKKGLSASEKNCVIKACYRQVFERDIAKAYSLVLSDLESKVRNGEISMKEFVRALGKSSIYRKQFCESFVDSRVLELAFRHFLGRGPGSIEEFRSYFSILAKQGLSSLVDTLVNSNEYSEYFGEETVPYLRDLGEEAQECRNWGAQINLLNYSAPFTKIPQFITLFSNYEQTLPDQHPYGRGNDPLVIQFGAIFPKENKNSNNTPAFFSKDTRRILIREGAGIFNQLSNPTSKSQIEGTLGPKVFKTSNSSIDSIITASYLRVFGRPIYEEEKSNFQSVERKLQQNTISVKEFIEILTKSDVFRKLYWNNLYICKAIEYIHNRLLGRPTYGRQEINSYFNIAYKEGYFALIDAILNSNEYDEAFGSETIPYDRYTTPKGLALKSFRPGLIKQQITKSRPKNINKFIELGKITELRTTNNIIQRINQGVSDLRTERVIFSIQNNSNVETKEQILKAVYRQIFERDINFAVGHELSKIENKFFKEEMSVKELVKEVGTSGLYSKEFYQPYPNTKVIELGTKHFLGRAPNNQAEIRYYNQILASKGIVSFVKELINSAEYDSLFGNNTVPYRRFPTLPAANFPNTEILYNRLTKQDYSIVVPSFKPAKGNQ
uniref:phycytochrome bilisome core-membrane linker protein n=1 Tax=Pulvinaster venetus TaxID=427767 RepID=UPI001FCE0DD5|nr:phycytochrome bilisome core-membrane linker protein [Pulvinaster venetus]UNJ17026.1 phycytochrome bilisome core-membrane linker protein [Pulvinaster venetus]